VIASPHCAGTTSAAEDGATLRRLIGHIGVAMFVTLDGFGRPTSRPMAVIMSSDAPDLWFIAPEHAAVIAEIRACSDVMLQFVDQPSRFVSVIGRAHVHRDPAQARQLWTPEVGPWIDRHEADRASLIHVNVDRADCWDAPGATARILQFVRPVATMAPRVAAAPDGLRLH
jgi:general stress protein 26